MRPTFKSSSVIVSPPLSPTSAEMRQIARKWELFVNGTEVDLSEVPPIIRDAWIRSQQAGVDPNLPHAPWHEIPNDPEILRQEIDWLPCAENIFSLFANFFTEPHQVVCLVDHQGRLLFVRGGSKGLAMGERIHAIPGGEWGEKKAGCNIFGTSLYTGLPVQVCWHENYIVSLHEWTSQAAPIHHPVTGEVLGAIGIGGHKESNHPRALELFIQAAAMIEDAIREQETTARLAILDRFAQLTARYPADGLVAVDKHGHILSLSPATEKMLSLPSSRLIGRRVEDIAGLRERVGQIMLAAPNQRAQAQGASGVTVFPVPGEHTPGAVILLPQPRQVTTKRQSEQPWQTMYTFADLIGQSAHFRNCIDRAHLASQHDWPVLLLGESGTGKELFAQSIHNAGPQHSGPFIPLDCAGISDELIGMELFGYEEGAFTGAQKGGKPGKIRMAHEGTLFLDDVDNLPAKVQTSLLRVLETGQVVPLGGQKPQRVQIRVIAASNSDLERTVRDGKFRHDLYHRIKVFTLTLPPLRERQEDIPELTQYILSVHAPQVGITDEALSVLQCHSWPGNVRELKNVLLEAATYAQSREITAADLPPALTGAAASEVSQSRRRVLDNTEAELILQSLQQTTSIAQAAQRLGLHHATLYRKMKKYGIPLSRAQRRA